MVYQLVIAEKPSVAQSIASVIGAIERKKGFFIGSGYIVSWCLGHLITFASADSYDERFLKWNYKDLPIIPDKWKYEVAPDKREQVTILSTLLERKDIDTVINGTDAGREGELIFKFVYNYSKCQKPIKRLWISSMEESAIKNGFATLRSGTHYENLYQAALCRAQADWIVGINATRLFSVLYNETLPIGRVQSPTLALIVQRENAITNFKKEPFYTISIDCGAFIASSEKIKEKEKAEQIQLLCQNKCAYIRDVKQQEKSISPPKLYDLTTLQREANRFFGYTAQQTLDYMQNLYEKKLVTYPRTDSCYLTEDMENGVEQLAREIVKVMDFLAFIQLEVNAKQVIDNKKVSDHHAIIPTTLLSKTNISSLSLGEKTLLNLICIRFLCAIDKKHVYLETTIVLSCENISFTAKGKTVITKGWKSIDDSYKRSIKKQEQGKEEKEQNTLPMLENGTKFDFVKSALQESFSSPPKHYTEDSLLLAMETAGTEELTENTERKGLGTPATRASIIEKLVKTNLIIRKDKLLLPTEKGTNLIKILPDIMKSPKTTAEWESKLKQIECGTLNATIFMQKINCLIKEIVETNAVAKEEYKLLFGLGTQTEEKEAIGICPRCKNKVVERKKGFFCENKSCNFALWKEDLFFKNKKKTLTKEVASSLLKNGFVFVPDLYSEKTHKTYGATIVLNDTKEKYVHFKLEFSKK